MKCDEQSVKINRRPEQQPQNQNAGPGHAPADSPAETGPVSGFPQRPDGQQQRRGGAGETGFLIQRDQLPDIRHVRGLMFLETDPLRSVFRRVPVLKSVRPPGQVIRGHPAYAGILGFR